MRISFILILFLTSFSIYGQSDLVVSNYSWDESPEYEIDADADEAMIAIMEKYITEYSYSEDGEFTEHYLEHKVLWLNSNDKIERYNRIYLPYSSTSELLESKARVITKSGKIIDLDDSKIFTAQDEETGSYYKYFAFEGVELGSVIEYYYTERTSPDYSGTVLRLQSDYIKKAVDFDLYAPSNLVFAFKSYNGLPDVVRDTTDTERFHWKLSVEDLDGLENEEDSPYDAYRGLLVYKLDKNLNTGKDDLSSYGDVAQNIYGYYNIEPSKKAMELIQAFVADANIENEDAESKIRILDNLIKSSFILSGSSSEDLDDLEVILEQKVASNTGMTRLYISLIKYLDLDHEVVLTSDRNNQVFDKDFEAHNFLSYFLIYFPKFKTYLSPTKMETRYGFPPVFLTDNYGLFIKEVSIGDYKSGLGRIKYIEPVKADKTVDRMILDVQFDEEDITINRIKWQRSFTGYYAAPLHPYMGMIVGEDRDDLIKSLAESMNEGVEIISGEVVNDDPQLFGKEPLKFIVEVELDDCVEKAGRKYLFKIGELIGPQVEMYQEKQRILPYDSRHQRSYFRTINVKIPDGYRIANPEDLNIDNKYEEDGVELFSFLSYYEIKDGVLKITADEHYRKNTVSPAIFEEYRTVINSAADFNKIVLILEPE